MDRPTVSFRVTMDAKAWTRFADRMRRRGLQTKTDEELLEIAVASMIGDVALPASKPAADSSTGIMMTGRMKVEKVD